LESFVLAVALKCMDVICIVLNAARIPCWRSNYKQG